MSIRQLSEFEVAEVSGGALATSFVKTNISLDSLLPKIGNSGNVAAVCQCVNCCSHHIEMEDLVVTPQR
ncbi:MAG: hypothetical protein P8179_21620 [Candidatus Thiodiazotropha sp.]|jgi:hypothetical protein